MRNQFEQDDWYNQSENRRRQSDRNSSYGGNDFRNQDNDQYSHQGRYSDRGYGGRSGDLHASHPYDYGRAAEGSRDMGSGYFSPPSYQTHQGPDRYPSNQAGSRNQDSWDQNRWQGNSNASYQDRSDYMRDRDRHSASQHWDTRNRNRSEDQNDFRQRNQFNPWDREQQHSGSVSSQWNRNPGNSWQEDRQQNWNENRSQRDFFDRAGDQVRSWFGDEEAERRRRMDEINDRSNRDENTDYHHDRW